MCLASHFRLLQMCEGRQHDGDLEEIDALLGGCSPVYLPLDPRDSSPTITSIKINEANAHKVVSNVI